MYEAVHQKVTACRDVFRDFCINTDWSIVNPHFQAPHLFHFEEFFNPSSFIGTPAYAGPRSSLRKALNPIYDLFLVLLM